MADVTAAQEIEWEQCLIAPTRDRELERYAKQAFGLVRSPFTDEVEKLYFSGDFEAVKNRIIEFLKLATLETIGSSRDYGMEHNIHRSDAKLLKILQHRLKELEQKRKHDPFFRGIV